MRFFAEEDARRPNQRPTTAMLGNEVMSKEQCYDLYQQILGVKKFEHQLLYNAMQVSISNIGPYSAVPNFHFGSFYCIINQYLQFYLSNGVKISRKFHF